MKTIVSEKQQFVYIIKVSAFFWLVTKIWSYKTWIADRAYPVIPTFDIFRYVPDSVHLVLFGLSLFSLLLIIIIKKNKLLLILLFVSEFISCMLDTVRWQPWEYMYLCMLLVVIINFSKPKNALFLFHLFLVAMYLFSGLHKLNRDFLSVFWMNAVLRDFFGMPLEFILKFKLFFVGLLIPIIEIILAVSLLLSKSKRKISFFLILMHVFILILIGPLGLDYNSVVWFWNFLLIFILFLLYVLPMENPDHTMVLKNSYWIVLWFLMPVFSFFGSWYQYFSFNLYSGKGYQMYICIHQQNNQFKPFFEPENNELCGDQPSINLQNWAMSEIKSAPNPELEVYRKISLFLKKKYGKQNIKVFLHHPKTNKTEEL